MTNTNRPIRRALVSVFHKEGIEVLAEAFIKAGTEVVSTGSTAKRLAELGVAVTEVSEVTGFPECLDGRVKTLDPHIHAGILADMTNPDHAAQLEKFGIKPFDLVVVNLYPFADTVRSGADEAAVIEKIDIGGPSMVRGAAKNSATVAIVTDPADYALVAARVANGEGFSLEERHWLAGKAFAHTAAYDATINEWTAKHWPKPATVESADPAEGENPVNAAKFPAAFTRTWDRAHTLRYGENPHQKAAFYRDLGDIAGTLPAAKQLHGKELSYNNINDTNGALELLREFDTTAVVAVKHGNPCGVGVANEVSEAYRLAYEADPVSVFGGIVVTNGTVDAATGMISGGERNDTKNIGYDFRTVLGSNISENVDFTLSWAGTYNEATNSLGESGSKNRYFNHTAQGNMKFVFPLGFTFTGSVAYTQYIGFTNDYDDSYLLCNAWIGKKVFKNKRGEIMVGVNDIFNQNKAFARSTGSGWTQNSTNSVIGRYYMVQFTYNLRRFGKKGSKNIKDYDGVAQPSGSRRMGPGGPGGPPPGMFHGPR